MVRVHGNRLWLAGDPDHPSRLYFSEILNAEQWEPVDFEDQNQDFLIPADAGFLEIEPADGQRIRAIGQTHRGLLPVYKDQSIFSIAGNEISNFVVRKLTTAAGAVSHFGVVNAADDQFFTSRAGVHSLSASDNFGDLEQSLISRDIRDYWNEFVNVEALQQGCYMVDNEPLDRLEILVPTYAEGADGFTPNRILCLHYGVRNQLHPFGMWSVKKIEGRSMATTRLAGASRSRVLVGSTDGYLNLQDCESAIDFPAYRMWDRDDDNDAFNRDTTLGTNYATINLSTSSLSAGSGTIQVGLQGGDRHGFAAIYKDTGSVPIAQGRSAYMAILLLKGAFTNTDRYCNIRVTAELSRAPSTFSTYADWEARTQTNSFIDVNDVIPLPNSGDTVAIDISPLFDELTNLSDWAGDGTDTIALNVLDNGSFASPFTAGSSSDARRRFSLSGVSDSYITLAKVDT